MIRRLVALLALLPLACCTAPQSGPVATRAIEAGDLRLASWNLEFLAERDGVGCRPRTAADYRAMRAIADRLGADVIAFQEAESVKAAERVFDPARYVVIMEARAGDPSGTCGGDHPEQPFIRQAVGFAIRKGIAFERHPDVTRLMLGNPQLRSGIDVTIRPKGRAPVRLLGIHLKSGCFSGTSASACPVLLRQVPQLESWIDAAAAGPTPFVVMGDWNRRLAMAGDPVWADLDDGEPANADLRLADADTPPRCDPRYGEFIDHIVLDRRAGARMTSFTETIYAAGAEHASDHCPISVTVR
jgi:endonuclease/exonuclease/phosphatase family metal-dependent hydrolase